MMDSVGHYSPARAAAFAHRSQSGSGRPSSVRRRASERGNARAMPQRMPNEEAARCCRESSDEEGGRHTDAKAKQRPAGSQRAGPRNSWRSYSLSACSSKTGKLRTRCGEGGAGPSDHLALSIDGGDGDGAGAVRACRAVAIPTARRRCAAKARRARLGRARGRGARRGRAAGTPRVLCAVDADGIPYSEDRAAPRGATCWRRP